MSGPIFLSPAFFYSFILPNTKKKQACPVVFQPEMAFFYVLGYIHPMKKGYYI